MITIEYCEQGKAISDFDYSDWIHTVKNTKQDHTFQVSTSLPVDLVRLAIVRGELDCNNVTFLYRGRCFQANKYGAIPDSPVGFCDRGVSVSEDILECAIKKRRTERQRQRG